LKKIIYDITPFTTTDYKDHLSCIVWFRGCNMRCEYCYNCDIVSAKKGKYSLYDFLKFLKKRVGLLDGVVLSGGEASLYDLVPLCEKIKNLGFKIKLDTNGSNPKLLAKLVKTRLIDFVSLDFKAPQEKFETITKSKFYNNFLNSLAILINSNIEYEVRTTLHSDLLDEYDINNMQKVLVAHGYTKTFFIQNFLETKNFGGLIKSTQFFNREKLDSNLDIFFRN
jgi:pyruvate formate lyase activating enzyme